MRTTTLILAVLCLAVGCDQSGPGPLDDETLEILSRTGMYGAEVTYPDGYNATLSPDDYDMMRSLIAALGPIQSATEGTLDDYDYQLIYYAGMDPAFIKVQLRDKNEFIFEWGAYIYTGGDPKRFEDVVDTIRQRTEKQE